MLKLVLFALIFGVFLKQAYPLKKEEFSPKYAPFVCFKEGKYGRGHGKPHIRQFCRSFKDLGKDVKRCSVVHVHDIQPYEYGCCATHSTDSCLDEDHMNSMEKNASRNNCLIAEMEDLFYNETVFTDVIKGKVNSAAMLYCETKYHGKIVWDCFKVADNIERDTENRPDDMAESINEAAEIYYKFHCEFPFGTRPMKPSGEKPQSTGEATVNKAFLLTLLLGVLCVILS